MVILTVRRDELEAFRRYETAAAAAMTRYGGALERTVAGIDASDPALVREVHLVRFPDEPAFAAYRLDPALRALAPLRERAVVATEILAGADGPRYDGA